MTLEQAFREESVPVVVADDEGFITFVNARFEDAFGWRREELVGQQLTAIIPPVLRDSHHLGFSRFLLTETPRLLDRPLALRVLARDGGELDAEHFISAERRGERWVFVATIRPCLIG